MINKENFEEINELKALLSKKQLKIFVINYEPLKDRRNYLKRKFKEFGIENFVFWKIQRVDEYKKECLRYAPSKKKWESRLKFIDGEKFRELRKSDINIFLNYLWVYNEIVRRKIKLSLIFEDDVIFEEDFIKRFIKVLKELPDSLDFAYTDAGMHLRLNKDVKNIKFFRYNGPLIRTTASHFVSFEGAKIVKKGLEMVFPIDLELRYFEKKNNLKVFWLDGFLTYQGSLYGNFYPTTMQVQRSSFGFIKKFIFSIEKKRFNNTFISNLQVFLLDYLIIIPYRKLRMFFKKP